LYAYGSPESSEVTLHLNPGPARSRSKQRRKRDGRSMARRPCKRSQITSSPRGGPGKRILPWPSHSRPNRWIGTIDGSAYGVLPQAGRALILLGIPPVREAAREGTRGETGFSSYNLLGNHTGKTATGGSYSKYHVENPLRIRTKEVVVSKEIVEGAIPGRRAGLPDSRLVWQKEKRDFTRELALN